MVKKDFSGLVCVFGLVGIGKIIVVLYCVVYLVREYIDVCVLFMMFFDMLVNVFKEKLKYLIGSILWLVECLEIYLMDFIVVWFYKFNVSSKKLLNWK